MNSSVVILNGVLGGMLLAAVANLKRLPKTKYFIAGLICWPIALLVCLLAKVDRHKLDGATTPRPGPKFASTTASWLLVVVCAFGFFGMAKWLIFRSAPYDLSTLECDRYLLVADVQEAFRQDQSANTNPTINRINDLKEILRSSSELSCSGSAKMNDGTTSDILFRYFIEAGAPHIAYQLKNK
jgi:hypothetical protein